MFQRGAGANICKKSTLHKSWGHVQQTMDTFLISKQNLKHMTSNILLLLNVVKQDFLGYLKFMAACNKATLLHSPALTKQISHKHTNYVSLQHTHPLVGRDLGPCKLGIELIWPVKLIVILLSGVKSTTNVPVLSRGRKLCRPATPVTIIWLRITILKLRWGLEKEFKRLHKI